MENQIVNQAPLPPQEPPKKSNSWIWILLAVLLLAGVFWYFSQSNNNSNSNPSPGNVSPGITFTPPNTITPPTTPTNPPANPGQDITTPPTEFNVSYTNSGFSHAGGTGPITIKRGDILVFTNNSTREFQPASATHPTHKDYPENQNRACPDPENFDACSPLPPGSFYKFRFYHSGTWTFHDHLAPEFEGRVIVE